MEVSVDIYRYLLDFAEDKDVLSMLSVNKKFDDPVFFQKVLNKRYPYLLKFKTEESTWRQFYISMIFYISKMKENIYTKSLPSFDPARIEKVQQDQKTWYFALSAALQSKNYPLIVYFTDKDGYNQNYLVGFRKPVLINESLANFLKNANFPSDIKNLISLLLKNKFFTTAMLIVLFNIYNTRNNLIFQENGKYLRFNEELEKYLGNDVKNKLPSLNVNKYRYSDIPKIINIFINRNNTSPVSVETARLLYGISEFLNNLIDLYR